MYKVIESFADAQDYNHVYHVGDEYPREGFLVSDARIEELASKKNRLRTPLIKLMEEKKEVKKEEAKPKKKAEENK